MSKKIAIFKCTCGTEVKAKLNKSKMTTVVCRSCGTKHFVEKINTEPYFLHTIFRPGIVKDEQ